MWNKSIAYRLSIYISIAVISVFLAFIVFAFYFNSGLIKNNIENKATALGLQAMMLGEGQLVSTREITTNISEQVMFFAQQNDVEFLVSKLMVKYPFLNAIHVNINIPISNLQYHNYYYFRSGDSISWEKANAKVYHCNIEKRIFEKMNEIGTPGWTETYKCHRNNKHVVAYYSPILVRNAKNEMVSAGSVLIELSLSDLSDVINSLKIGKSGYAVLVSQDGTYLFHPNNEYILNRNLYSLPNKVSNMEREGVNKVLTSGLAGTTIAYPEYLNYEKCWVHYSPIKETNWTLIFVVPYDELFISLYLLVLRMLFFAVLGILVIFFIVTYISNKLILPLSNVTTQLKNFSSFSGEFKLNTRNEIELVSESLNFLKIWYEKFEIEHRRKEILDSQWSQDLIQASEIQMSLINTDFSIFTERNDIDLFAIYKPARIVSGDLFDFILLDNDNLFFTIGDVSGKGLSAAFFMSVAQTLLKNNARLKMPGKIVATANNELYTVNKHQFFLTLFCGVINLKTGILKYCNAAHTSTLILNMKGELTELEQSHGMPLGLYPNRNYDESTIKLKPGDSIVLFSDGVIEQQDDNNRYFGIERFCKILNKSTTLKPKTLITEIEKNLDLFKGQMMQTDDITIMVLKYNNKQKA